MSWPRLNVLAWTFRESSPKIVLVGFPARCFFGGRAVLVSPRAASRLECSTRFDLTGSHDGRRHLDCGACGALVCDFTARGLPTPFSGPQLLPSSSPSLRCARYLIPRKTGGRPQARAVRRGAQDQVGSVRAIFCSARSLGLEVCAGKELSLCLGLITVSLDGSAMSLRLDVRTSRR